MRAEKLSIGLHSLGSRPSPPDSLRRGWVFPRVGHAQPPEGVVIGQGRGDAGEVDEYDGSGADPGDGPEEVSEGEAQGVSLPRVVEGWGGGALCFQFAEVVA